MHGLFIIPLIVSAQGAPVDDLRRNIEDRTEKILELEKEIEKYEVELETVGKEKTSLQSAIKTLDISQKKIQTEQNVTENKVSATNLQIEKLALEIAGKENDIDRSNRTLATSLREINEIDNNSFVEVMLATGNLSDVWNQVENLRQFQQNLRAGLMKLRDLKTELQTSLQEREERRQELLAYTEDLRDKEYGIQITKKEKNTLLIQTKNKESNYTSILEEKKAARAEFEQELLEFESQLKFALDPTALPNARPGVLSWPLDSVKVTQHFGKTDFAERGAYNGQGHNGIDLRASAGTRVKTALSGEVTATGDTDTAPGCYSYGKWVLIRHMNGLSSLYAHLSHIGVETGAIVTTGQTIGFSGSTGYSTGPHLHFTVFATQGVQIIKMGEIKAKTNCASAVIPVAPHKAYLDPLSYLPSL